MKNFEKFQLVRLNKKAMKSVIGGNPIGVAVMALAGIAVAVIVEDYANDGGSGSSSSSDSGSTAGSTAGAGAIKGSK